MKIKQDYFISKMFYRLLIPSMFSSLGFAFADVIDTLVLGQKIGPTGLAAISLCLPLFMLINLFMDGFGIGGCIRFSQYLGEGNPTRAVKCFNRTWLSTLAFGILIALLINICIEPVLSLLGTVPEDGALYHACKHYVQIIALGAPALMLNIVFANFLRNDNNPGMATVGFLAGNAVDIVLNILFVVFLEMGSAGAALATVIGSLIAIGIYLPGIIGKKANMLKIERPGMDIKETLSCFQTGFSTSIQHLFQLIFLIWVNRLLMDIYGEGGAAIFDVVYSLSFFIVYIYNGTGEAAQPLISVFSGENSTEDCKYIHKLSVLYGIGAGAVITALLVLFPEPILAAFGINDALMPLAVIALRLYCAGFALVGLNIISENYYQSMEKTPFVFFIAFLRGFAVLLPCSWILSMFEIGHVNAIWMMYPVAELITFLLFCLFRAVHKEKKPPFPAERILRLTMENDTEKIGELLDRSTAFCETWNATVQQTYSVTLVVEEICTSIMRNAMETVPDGMIRVTILAMENGDFVLHVLDNAVVFNPFSLKGRKANADTDFDIDEISLLMIKKKSKEFMYRRNNGFNSLVIRV